MKKLEFKPEDFKCNQPVNNALIAGIAQSRFDQWYYENIESAPVVYGVKDAHDVGWLLDISQEDDTLQARLICIEPIPKKKCAHESWTFESFDYGRRRAVICAECKKELKPKGGWEVV